MLATVVFVAGLLLLPRQLGKAKSSKTIRGLFGKTRGVERLFSADHRDDCRDWQRQPHPTTSVDVLVIQTLTGAVVGAVAMLAVGFISQHKSTSTDM